MPVTSLELLVVSHLPRASCCQFQTGCLTSALEDACLPGLSGLVGALSCGHRSDGHGGVHFLVQTAGQGRIRPHE